MLTTIKGIYEHCKVILTEEPPVKRKADVIVTFLATEEKKISNGKHKIILGLMEDKIKMPDDFNEPLDDLKEYM